MSAGIVLIIVGILIAFLVSPWIGLLLICVGAVVLVAQ